MSYLDRLRTCAYRSPSGATFTMSFDDVERSGSRKAAIHELPQQDIPDVQDLGNNGERFPLSVYFTGDDYDQQADAFLLALKERGAGALAHPRWGDIPVLALTWSQSESFVENMGRADFSVEFIYAPETVAFPITTVQTQETVTTAAVAASADAKASFEAGFAPVDAADVATCKASVLTSVRSVTAGFQAMTNGVDEFTRQIENQISTIESTIDDLVAAPGELFDAMQRLYDIPASLPGRISDKLTSYAAQLAGLLERMNPTTPAQAQLDGATASMVLASTATATTIGTTASRQEAVRNADSVEQIRTDFQAIIEQAEAAVSDYQPDQVAMAALTDTIIQAAEAVRQASFDLRSERRYIVPADTPTLALLWRFYGSIDALDEFIESNDLQGDEIIMAKAGREVVYYEG